jgi:hypothetical protein
MNRPPAFLRRVLTVLLAVTPLLAGADLCTVGALTGRASLACAMEGAAVAPCAASASAPAPRCSHCAPAAPAKAPSRPHGPTCCDLRPQAADAAGTSSLAAPSTAQHAAVAPVPVVPVTFTVSAVRVAPDDGRAPPGHVALDRAPRAPPLA